MGSKPAPFLNIGTQAAKLKAHFPNAKLIFNHNQLVWTGSLKPSPLSPSYIVKVSYVRGKHPNVYVKEPRLKFATGNTCLPHVYNTSKQWLCIYHRKSKEWNRSMALIDTVFPWTCEWLLHYEIWLITGSWRGGGIDHLGVAKNHRNE